MIVSWLVPSLAASAPVIEPALIVKVSLPVPELSAAIEPALLFIVRLLSPLPKSTLLARDTPLLLPLIVSVSLPPWRSSCSKELKPKEPVEAASLMLPLLALERVVTSLVLPAELRRMSLPLVPTRFSMLMN